MPQYLYTFDSLVSGSSQAPEGLDPAGFRSYLEQNMDTDLVTDKNIDNTLKMFFPESLKQADLILQGDARTKRQELVKRAQEKLVDAVYERGPVPVPEEAAPYQAQMFLREDREGNKAHNDRLRKAMEDGDLKTQAEMYGAYLAGLPQFDPDGFADLSDDRLVEIFPSLYGLYQAATEAVRLLREKDPDSLIDRVSPETRKRMEQLALDQRLLAAMKNRFETIADPYYAVVDTERLLEEETAAQCLDHMARDYRMRPGFAVFAGQLSERKQTRSVRDLAAGRRMGALLLERGLDPDTVQICDTANRQYPLWEFFSSGGEAALNNGTPLIFRDGKGHAVALRQGKEKPEEMDLDGLAARTQTEVLTTRLDRVRKLTTSSVADPFWMITGSGEYRELKAALEEHADAVRQAGDPPREESLRALQSSVERLGAAAQRYLVHKDPTVGENIDFAAYKKQLGEDSALSERELARMEAAFAARDLARDTRGAVAVNRQLNSEIRQSIAVDRVFYQGLLRKYDRLEKQLEERMQQEEFGEKLAVILTEEGTYNSTARPDPNDPDRTLLWELRQMNDLIERTEQAMGLRASQRAIDQTMRDSVKTSSFFGGQDPAELSVEELFDGLEQAVKETERQQFRQAKQPSQQSQPQSEGTPRKPDYKAREFVVDKKIINSEIVGSNNSAEVQSFLDRNRSQLSSAARDHLKHRVKSLERIEELEKHPEGRKARGTYTATRDGKKVEGPLKHGDKIMLEGVHERRSQNTMNGCWSVSLCSQLEYRGVELSQEEIRAYRPNVKESGTASTGREEVFYQNRKQAIGDYNGLVGRVLPNSHLNCSDIRYSVTDENQVREARDRIRASIFTALTVDNSPVSMCARGHYVTIVGMEGDTFYVKNPMHLLGGDPEKLEKWTLDDIMKKANGLLELDWISDLKPTLGGNVKTDRPLEGGFFYSGGIGYQSTRNEEANPVNEQELVLTESMPITIATVEGKQVKTGIGLQYARRLHYKRLPGGEYNADVLKEMTAQLEAVPDPAPGLQYILDEAGRLERGSYETNPHKGMLSLAQRYLDALQETDMMIGKGSTEHLTQYRQLLVQQLKDIRTAVTEMQQTPYKLKMGSIDDPLAYGNLDQTDKINKVEYAKRRKTYENMKEGLSGAVYFNTVGAIELEDPAWIRALSPDAVRKGSKDIKNSDGFQSMIGEIYNEINDFDSLITKDYNKSKGKKEEKSAEMDPQAAKGLEQRRRELLDLIGADYDKYFVNRNRNDQDSNREKDITYGVKLRQGVRRGDTDALYKRYLRHVNKVREKKDVSREENAFVIGNSRKVEERGTDINKNKNDGPNPHI